MALARVCRAMLATPVTLKVKAGKMAWRSLSSHVTALSSTPMGTESPMGSQPNHTEKTKSSKSASQKAGVLEITRQ